MTCIIGILDKKKRTIFLGGDSAGVAGQGMTIVKKPKVFMNREFIMGYTDSFRMGQVLEYGFIPPKHPKGMGVTRYMVTDFMDHLRICFKDAGYMKIDGEREQGGAFIVGYKGHLFGVESDLQVTESRKPFEACGSGSWQAEGALYATQDWKDPVKRIRMALRAAAEFIVSVRGPFTIKSLRY